MKGYYEILVSKEGKAYLARRVPDLEKRKDKKFADAMKTVFVDWLDQVKLVDQNRQVIVPEANKAIAGRITAIQVTVERRHTFTAEPQQPELLPTK